MKFISDCKELGKTFESLCQKYSHYEWAVAWAGEPSFPIAKQLSRFEPRIKRMVIGLHFYQTSPDFIRRYKDNCAVRFYWQTDGTFHSKLYLFYNTRKDWSALVGSSNFTKAGFYENEEANVLITSNDGGTEMFDQISNYISSIWDKSKMFKETDLEKYEAASRTQRKKLESLSRFQTSKEEVMASSFSSISWDEFYNKVMEEGYRPVDERISILKTAHALFKKYDHFDDMPDDARKCIAGFVVNLDEDVIPKANWLFFGSMKGSGWFEHDINHKERIGKALDGIPLYGKVSRKQFEQYCDAFSHRKNPLGTATRLLAIKRPDLFVCIDSKNRDKLSKFLKIPKSKLTLENYWDQVLERIYHSDWFLEQPVETEGREASVKKYQVAMIDSFCYDRDE
jgi:hypothetical protein